MPYDIAGVTLLAFGNGAPDVFSSIAAFSSGVADTGLNELLGGTAFVSTVVVGCVSIASRVDVDAWAFARDGSALLAALLLLLVLSKVQHDSDHFLQAFAFAMLYAAYVCVATLPECVRRCCKRPATGRKTQTVAVDGDQSAVPRGVLSAFWHSALSPRSSTQQIDGGDKTANDYTFVTRLDAELRSPGRFSSSSQQDATSQQPPQPQQQSIELSSPRVKRAQFRSAVFDDHFPDMRDESFASPLLCDEERGTMDDDLTQQLATRWPMTATGAGLLDGAYWSHLRWRRRLKRRIGEVLDSDAHVCVKVAAVPQALLVLVRDLTIPTLEPDNWSRVLATASPIGAALFILNGSGFFFADFAGLGVPAWAVVLSLGVGVSLFVSFTTHRSKPPESLGVCLLLVVLAFGACVAWIYQVANELMAVLIALGHITKLSNSLLGLTVLSWGNSVGDLITNVSVARAGFPQMAIAGCFGGPVFNILVGLGVPMALGYVNHAHVDLALDVHARISLVFLFVTLTATFGVFACHRFHCPAWHGRLLVVLYVLFTLVHVAVAFHWIG